jgi:sulfatase-like protein
MYNFSLQHPTSILFITLDSCRYDTFQEAQIPHLKSIGKLYRAMAPGNFTFSSHAAMFVGFTPGVAEQAEPFVNPKFAKIFKMAHGGFASKREAFMILEGANIIEGLKRLDYFTLGSGAVNWFNPQTETGRYLSRDFDHFYFPGNYFLLKKQLAWISDNLRHSKQPVFVFLNIGETHVPYYYEGAPWNPDDNPCIPFSETNNVYECRRRQITCLEYVDSLLAPLLEAFRDGTIIICADHGDCWGEDGLWEHGIYHKKVLEVPLLFKLGMIVNVSKVI